MRKQISNFVTHSLLVTRHASRVTGLILLAACAPTPQQQSTEFLAMGTTVSITVVGKTPDATRKAINEARLELQRIGREWYPWSSDGELVRLNVALAADKTESVSPPLAQLLQRSQEYFRVSEGHFDPAIGGLVRLWGFHSGATDDRVLPAEKHLNSWVKSHPTMANVHIEGGKIRSDRRDLVLDLGAIGKGNAVDRAIELLQQHGFHDALVNASGNLRAIGSNSERPWRVAIKDPRAVRTLGWLELRNESVSTSGDYERYVLVRGKRLHHLLDPRTARPVEHTIAVTVIASDATLADAASTALFIAGPARWLDVARALGIGQALRVDASGQVQVTRQLQSRLQLPSSETRATPWSVVDLPAVP